MDRLAEDLDDLLAISNSLKNIDISNENVPDWKNKVKLNQKPHKNKEGLSIAKQRENLPIYKLKDAFIEQVKNNRVLVVIGETGSGKTTQMTQYLVEAGFAATGQIGCTQPRRFAAMAVARRVSEEFGCELGTKVGYRVRFQDCTDGDTIIKYMTDGILVRECSCEPLLKSYSVIMLDEAHERTIQTDILFGLLKQIMVKRNDLKLIVTSATLDSKKFSKYFFDAPIFTIEGRTYPVEIVYRPLKPSVGDYVDAAINEVERIHRNEKDGDVLVFLTGQDEIDNACERMSIKHFGPDMKQLIVLPLYSNLPTQSQTQVFEPAAPNTRKVIISTNIAETSLTIDGVLYVVDCGYVKQKYYCPAIGMDSLDITRISKAHAKQRAGRAGRTGPGKCFRLYDEKTYTTYMSSTPVPEIQRANLASVVLQLKKMDIVDVINFDYLDAPPSQNLSSAVELLHSLNALDSQGLITSLGRRMADFPLEPNLAKLLIMSVHLNCSEEIITIVSMLSVQNHIFYRPKRKASEADEKKRKFQNFESDHLTLLSVYNKWRDNNCSPEWCYENFINKESLKDAYDIREQLIDIMRGQRIEMQSAGLDTERIKLTICAGYFQNAATTDLLTLHAYRTITGDQKVFIHPSSALFRGRPKWVIYHEIVKTKKEYMRTLTSVDNRTLSSLVKESNSARLKLKFQLKGLVIN